MGDYLMEPEPKIYQAICDVMADIGAVGKNDVNKTQGFKYRGIDSVMNAINPAMVKHKVFCAPEILEQTREERKSTAARWRKWKQGSFPTKS